MAKRNFKTEPFSSAESKFLVEVAAKALNTLSAAAEWEHDNDTDELDDHGNWKPFGPGMTGLLSVLYSVGERRLRKLDISICNG